MPRKAAEKPDVGTKVAKQAAQPNATAKSQRNAKTLKGAGSPVGSVEQHPATTTPEKPPPNFARRPDRRCTQEQAERAIKSKLLDHGFDKSMVDTLEDSDGHTILHAVMLEMERQAGVKKKLTIPFWISIHERFQLKQCVFSGLPDIPEGYEFPDGMEDVVTPARDDTPIARSPEPFVRY